MKQTLQIHKNNIHFGIQYKCNTCNQSFKERSALYKHNGRVHQENTNYKCGICGKTFKDGTQRRSHENYIHFDETSCLFLILATCLL